MTLRQCTPRHRPHPVRPRSLRAVAALGVTAALTLGACADDPATDGSTTEAPVTGAPAAEGTDGPLGGSGVAAGEPFPEERCAANREAGTIRFLTSFDFAAAASIVEVLMAEHQGYYDDLCLDVSVEPSFSTANYPLVAANEAQLSSAGSFSEVVSFADANDAEFRVLSVDGHVPIDVLMVKPETAGDDGVTAEDLRGATIGVKGKLPPSIAAMLAASGLQEGDDYTTVLLDGFDPVAHMALPDVDAVPGWKSNEPGQLERAGVPFSTLDPADAGIPGSFGIIYTNAEFAAAHPSALADFMRATLRGLADAIADPEGAAAVAVDLINGNGNPNYLSPEGEGFRWATEARLITETTPAGEPIGAPIVADLQAELDAHAAVGLFGGATPAADGSVDADLVRSLYGSDGTVIWPVTR